MDDQRAAEVLDQFISSIDQHDRLSSSRTGPSAPLRSLGDQIQARAPLIEIIADHLEPGTNHQVVEEGYPRGWSAARRLCVRLKGILLDAEERARIVGPSGPQLAASRLHAWVWEPAAKLWDNGHRREAIQAAGLRLDSELQNKVGPTRRSGADLVRSAFSPDPPGKNEPRLRLRQYPAGTPTWTSAHEGAMQYGAGCFMAVRNIATHWPEQPEEQFALEQLAALSVLARWIDTAEVESVP